METIEQRLEKIEQRNKRVEANKAWETSLSRKFSILIMTYFVASLVFYYSGSRQPLIDSLVPTIAFFVSTLGLNGLKKIWLNIKNKDQNYEK